MLENISNSYELDKFIYSCTDIDVHMSRKLMHEKLKSSGNIVMYEKDVYQRIIDTSKLFLTSLSTLAITDISRTYCRLATCNHIHPFTPQNMFVGVMFSFQGRNGSRAHIKLSPYIGETGEWESLIGIRNTGRVFTYFPMKHTFKLFKATLKPLMNISYLNISPTHLHILCLCRQLNRLGFKFSSDRANYTSDISQVNTYLQSINDTYGTDYHIVDDMLQYTPKLAKNIPFDDLERSTTFPNTTSYIWKTY